MDGSSGVLESRLGFWLDTVEMGTGWKPLGEPTSPLESTDKQDVQVGILPQIDYKPRTEE